MRINCIQNFSKWMFVYYKCYIMIKLTFLKETDVNKTSESTEWDISHYCYFAYKGFQFQSYECSKCNDLVMISINLSDIAILNIKGAVLLAELAKVRA